MNFLTVKTNRKSALFRVGYLLPCGKPCPPYYGAAFAFSGILCPLRRPPSLRSGYRHMAERIGFTQLATEEMRASEVGACPPVGLRVSLPVTAPCSLPTYHFGYSVSAPYRCFRFTRFIGSLLSLNRLVLP